MRLRIFLITIDSANSKMEISTKAHMMACTRLLQNSSLALGSDNGQRFTQLERMCASLDRPNPLPGPQAGLPKKSRRRYRVTRVPRLESAQRSRTRAGGRIERSRLAASLKARLRIRQVTSSLLRAIPGLVEIGKVLAARLHVYGTDAGICCDNLVALQQQDLGL